MVYLPFFCDYLGFISVALLSVIFFHIYIIIYQCNSIKYNRYSTFRGSQFDSLKIFNSLVVLILMGNICLSYKRRNMPHKNSQFPPPQPFHSSPLQQSNVAINVDEQLDCKSESNEIQYKTHDTSSNPLPTIPQENSGFQFRKSQHRTISNKYSSTSKQQKNSTYLSNNIQNYADDDDIRGPPNNPQNQKTDRNGYTIRNNLELIPEVSERMEVTALSSLNRSNRTQLQISTIKSIKDVECCSEAPDNQIQLNCSNSQKLPVKIISE